MKKNYILMVLSIIGLNFMTAQNNINFDPAATNGTGWVGYMYG